MLLHIDAGFHPWPLTSEHLPATFSLSTHMSIHRCPLPCRLSLLSPPAFLVPWFRFPLCLPHSSPSLMSLVLSIQGASSGPSSPACLWVAGAVRDTAPREEKSHLLCICAFLSLLTFYLLPLSTLLLSLAYLAL